MDLPKRHNTSTVRIYVVYKYRSMLALIMLLLLLNAYCSLTGHHIIYYDYPNIH